MFSRLLAVLAFVTLATPASAVPVTYSYTGNNYSSIEESSQHSSFTPFDLSMSMTASIALSEALLPNTDNLVLSWSVGGGGIWSLTALPTFTSASIRTGRNTFSAAYLDPVPHYPAAPICCTSQIYLRLITDSAGAISDWILRAYDGAGRTAGEQWSAVTTSSGDTGYWQYSPGETYTATAAPGTWSVRENPAPPVAAVPLPAGLWMLAAAVAALLLLKRRHHATYELSGR
jgi:hypothetical protein